MSSMARLVFLQGFKGHASSCPDPLPRLRLVTLSMQARPQCRGAMDQCLSVGVEAAKMAGKVIADNFNAVKHVEHKGQVDLVTETDKACEKLVFEHIAKSFPNHKFIGEETTALTGSFELSDAPTWIIDPLDGTTNFVHRFPFVCISIGLVIEKQPVVGIVYNPILNELFSAVKGEGAFLNANPIRVSSQENIGCALLASEVGTKRDELIVDATTNRINNLLFKVRSVRMTGSCALNLCGIACGRLDIFYELGYGGPWDVAAGVVIVQEAGGMIFSPKIGLEMLLTLEHNALLHRMGY